MKVVLKVVGEFGTEEGQKGRKKDAMTDEDNSGTPKVTACTRFYLRSVLDVIYVLRFIWPVDLVGLSEGGPQVCRGNWN